jgi:hypothetical protein
MPRPLQSFMVNLGNAKPMSAFISTATVQSIPNAVNTTLTFATPVNNDPSNLNAWRPIWDPANPGKFTVPASGFYAVGASVALAAATNMLLDIRQNTVVIALQSSMNSAQLAVSVTVPARVGDIFDAQVGQSSGAPLNTAPLGLIPNLWIMRVG